MRKRFHILLIVLLVAVVGGLAWQVTRPREPMYRGKPLSFWMDGYQTAMDGGAAYRQAEEAVRQIGTNAIPTLLQMLAAKDSALTSKIFELAQKQHFIRVRHTSASQRCEQTDYVFRHLGASAKDAVPALIKIYDQNISTSSQWATAGALGWIGPAARSAVPSLLRGINNPDQSVRLSTIVALGDIHAESELVVPALLNCLQDSSSYIQKSALRTLAEFGPDARTAVPAIFPLLNDSTPWVRWEATNALKAIDPEAAAKAGGK